MCCNGVLFKDVELQSGDDAAQLRALGLSIRAEKFPQPCVALDGCRCRIYLDRPLRCRQFECALLQSVQSGEMEVPAALRVIRLARERAGKVRGLLRELGNDDESLALSLRFKRMKKRFESSPPDDDTAEVFSRLTLAVHDLNRVLREKFYPSPSD